MKTYTYNRLRYFFAVTLPAIVMLLTFLYSLLMITAYKSSILYYIIALCSLLVLGNFVITLSVPSKIAFDNNKIELGSFGRKHTYYWNEIKNLRVRNISGKRRIYLRISNQGLFKGKYWIDVEMFDNGLEIYDKLKYHEKK